MELSNFWKKIKIINIITEQKRLINNVSTVLYANIQMFMLRKETIFFSENIYRNLLKLINIKYTRKIRSLNENESILFIRVLKFEWMFN